MYFELTSTADMMAIVDLMSTIELVGFIDFTKLLPFALFGAIAIGAWVLIDTLFNSKTKSESRLEKMRSLARGETYTEPEKTSAKEGIAKLLESASPKFSEALQPKNEKEINKQKIQLDSAGFRSESAPNVLATVKVISGVFGLFLGGAGGLLTKGVDMWTAIYALGVGGLFVLLPGMVVNLFASKRKEKIFLGLPDALDLMTVCVEAGLGQDQAMRRVAEELDKTHPVIAEEFDICNKQLQMGKTREHVLQELGTRNDVDDLKTFSQVLIQVDKFGTSVAKALRTQSDAMRVRRRQLAEEKASKTAVYLLFPLVLFIFPGIFVVLVGPAAITMVNEMLPMMAGN
jgi:tight adherence protein C